MSLLSRLLVPALALWSAAPVSAVDPREAEAAAIALHFTALLQPQLKSALESGPPARAIPVCAEVAPAIAASLSAQTGWSVTRVSLKPRNPQAAPDDWERKHLQRFEAAVSTGAGAYPLGEEVDGRFRYLAPLQVQSVCLLCHGENIDADTAAALKRYYPADRATGYRPGDIRGGISVSSR